MRMKRTFEIYFQNALSDRNAIVATLCSLSDHVYHTVMIYAFENECFKVKDSHDKLFTIRIDRPDYYQVGHMIIII